MIIHTLRVARATQDLSQKRLAELAGISQTTLSFIETGTVSPRQSTKDSIEEVLGTEVDWKRTFSEGVIRQTAKIK